MMLAVWVFGGVPPREVTSDAVRLFTRVYCPMTAAATRSDAISIPARISVVTIMAGVAKSAANTVSFYSISDEFAVYGKDSSLHNVCSRA
jgi:hypothetical protein